MGTRKPRRKKYRVYEILRMLPKPHMDSIAHGIIQAFDPEYTDDSNILRAMAKIIPDRFGNSDFSDLLNPRSVADLSDEELALCEIIFSVSAAEWKYKGKRYGFHQYMRMISRAEIRLTPHKLTQP